MFVTKEVIEYSTEPYGFVVVIPKGTKVVPATNLPGEGKYWAEPWEGMSDYAESWQRNYGFLIQEDEIDCLVSVRMEATITLP